MEKLIIVKVAEMTEEDIRGILTAVSVLLNALFTTYFAWKKLRPEIHQTEVKTESEIVSAAERNLESAKISTQMLVDRINELKQELEAEKDFRKQELEAERNIRRMELETEKEARRKESEYFHRRIQEAEREARDYRLWAAKLVKQVVESGKVPVPFIPSSIEDSDPMLVSMVKENQAEVSKKWEERNKNDKQ